MPQLSITNTSVTFLRIATCQPAHSTFMLRVTLWFHCQWAPECLVKGDESKWFTWESRTRQHCWKGGLKPWTCVLQRHKTSQELALCPPRQDPILGQNSWVSAEEELQNETLQPQSLPHHQCMLTWATEAPLQVGLRRSYSSHSILMAFPCGMPSALYCGREAVQSSPFILISPCGEIVFLQNGIFLVSVLDWGFCSCVPSAATACVSSRHNTPEGKNCG